MRLFPALLYASLVMSFLPHISFAAPAVQLPKTGQTSCWGASGAEISCSSTGQDGSTQIGIAWPAPSRFTDNGNGTVTDRLTDLVWTKNADCFGILGWQQALDRAHSLATGTCGLNDGSTAGQWRLPNRKELLSIMSFQQPNGGNWLNGQGFVNGLHGWYWSSDSYAPVPSSKWVVHSVGAVWADNNSQITAPEFHALFVREPIGPVITVSPGAVAFGNVEVNARSDSRSLTLANPGSAALVVSSIALTGADPGSFVLQPGNGSGGTCGTLTPTIVAGQSCTVAIAFVPVAEGARTASVAISSNGGSSPTAVTVTGTGTITRYRVTAAVSGVNGSISSTNPQDIPAGSSAAITLAPSPGYVPGDVAGTCPAGSFNGVTYTTGAVTGECTVTFAFVPRRFTIGTAVSGSGTITCTPGSVVDYLTPVSCTAAAATGNLISAFSVDGVPAAIKDEHSLAHSFGPVTADHSLSATFAAEVPVFTVTPVTSGRGTVDPPLPQNGTAGSRVSFTFSPGSGYRIAFASGCGGVLEGTAFTTAPLGASCTVTVAFEPVTLADVVKAYMSVTGKVQLGDQEKRQYDVAPLGVDGAPAPNGVVDVADVVIMLRRISGLVTW